MMISRANDSDKFDDDNTDVPIDPIILAQTLSLKKVITEIENEELPQDSEVIIFDAVFHEDLQNALSSLSLKFMNFINYFVKINIVRNKTLTRKQSRSIQFQQACKKYAKNSKDKMTLFNYKCKSSIYECEFTSS